MNSALKLIVNEYGWIHISLGLFGNITFFVGSILFLPTFEEYKTLGVWLFIIGSFFMLIGSLGRLLVDITDNRHAD
ncbi:YrhK family protein [Alteromonas sp. ASW11-19]|uniref:YrhK family protein n=1 Tax=Alteromonas salexigens TaxID=2982530 RepID=A0ABT2VSJ4_9ALTE|nr:YrhK family protein [Alteromonas salexigens]MCU7556029.1 YrhK family protein [Alteromonas salexigens]